MRPPRIIPNCAVLINDSETKYVVLKRPKAKDAKPGRPRVEESISEAIIRIRKETGWGYTKIVQAMRRLGHSISRQTVKNVLVDAGLGPEPHDTPDTWSEFLKRHADTMWQCDFACKRKWTIKGMVDLYFLVFIHIGTRRIWESRGVKILKRGLGAEFFELVSLANLEFSVEIIVEYRNGGRKTGLIVGQAQQSASRFCVGQ